MTDKNKIVVFSRSFDQNQMSTVYQWVKRFGWSPEDERTIKEIVNGTLNAMRMAAEARGKVVNRRTVPRKKGAGKVATEELRERAQGTPIGICSCGGLIVGAQLPGCESRDTGRIFYKECSSCSYYSELFHDGDKYREVEGGA